MRQHALLSLRIVSVRICFKRIYFYAHLVLRHVDAAACLAVPEMRKHGLFQLKKKCRHLLPRPILFLFFSETGFATHRACNAGIASSLMHFMFIYRKMDV